MSDASWIEAALSPAVVDAAQEEAGRRRLANAIDCDLHPRLDDAELRFVADALELAVFEALDDDGDGAVRRAATQAFQVARSLPIPSHPIEASTALVRLGGLAVLADRGADMRRILVASKWKPSENGGLDWGDRVWASILEVWIRLFRKDGWADLDGVLQVVVRLREDQARLEPGYLDHALERRERRPAWELITSYHLARAAEVLALYVTEGEVEGHFDVREQLEAQFDRAIATAVRGGLAERELLARLLARTAQVLVANSLWSATRAVNSRVTKFVRTLTGRGRPRPIFEVLPPQRRTLREQGLLGSAHRAVVVSLPTSSGKTLIAAFRILQALNQFDHERGWVAYIAPTRALVNQLTVRLRHDLGSLGIVVEKVSPALEVDGVEAALLTEADQERQFRLLVTTPEKLDLMLRGGWEERIGRPLTLVVVDEAHGLGTPVRGLRLELLLATINRECRHAQFLLLTPFIPNAGEIARWLDRDSHQSIELAVDWTPNDRVIALAVPVKAEGRGGFRVRLDTLHTSRETLHLPEPLRLRERRPLGMSWSKAKGLGALAAATAQSLGDRGTIIVLVDSPNASWSVAKRFETDGNRQRSDSPDRTAIRDFLAAELGADFPLVSLLDFGVGVHHAGLPDDVRVLVEWLAERGELRAMVATTTVAAGVNFPVAGVVFASHQYRAASFPYRFDMPAEDFWNIAGRAGRVDQGDLGVVAMAAPTEEKAKALTDFVHRSVEALSSTLVEMVAEVDDLGSLLSLEQLSYKPEWSAFVQYLAHTYRQLGDRGQFEAQVEQILRGTLGFRTLRQEQPDVANLLVRGVHNYAGRLQGGPLKLVDATGFSLESVTRTLGRLRTAQIAPDVWSPELFGSNRRELSKLFGVLLRVPELRDKLGEVVGGGRSDGDLLSRVVCDWVGGRPLTEMAATYRFGAPKDDADDGKGHDPVTAMTRCCRAIFGRLTQTASWGLAALQSMTLGDSLEHMSEAQRREARNLPARVYYGVSSESALVLRLLNVPRAAAPGLATALGVDPGEPLHRVRARLRATPRTTWEKALGARGASYHRVWAILEGE